MDLVDCVTLLKSVYTTEAFPDREKYRTAKNNAARLAVSHILEINKSYCLTSHHQLQTIIPCLYIIDLLM